MILLSHPAANRAARHAAQALNRAGVLAECWTYQPDGPALSLRQIPPQAFPDATGESKFAATRGPEPSDGESICDGSDERSHALLRVLDGQMQARVHARGFDGVYAFEDGAEATFRAAADRGMLRIYDLPFGNWRGPHPILAEEAELMPAWAQTLGPRAVSSAMLDRTQAELAQADLVLVSSTFGLRTLDVIPGLGGTVAVVPPGIEPAAGPLPAAAAPPGARLRVLYAGSLSQRAGLAYAFAACRTLGTAVELTVVAPPSDVPCAALDRALSAVRWVATDSLPVLRREMEMSDVFLYPAIYDGGARLMLEALAHGLPVIGTEHSAAPDLVCDGVHGFIVPVRCPEAISAKLELLHRQRDLRAELAAEARRRVQHHSWTEFEGTVAALVATALGWRT